MLWWAGAAFFVWLALREIHGGFVAPKGFPGPQPIFKGYVLLMLAIAAALAYTPIRYFMFERFLSQKARILAESDKVTVHCNTLFDTVVDTNSLASGHANPETGLIAFQKPWCGVLMDHLRHPEKMDPKGVFAVQMFAHEAMHARGEMNEAITECEAIQRHYRAALLLGIPDEIAKRSGKFFYETQYQARRSIGGMQAAYYTDQCAPGKALDEKLSDSTWNP